MATLALAAAGAAAGGALLPTGISFLGTTLTGATIGSQLGALAGSVIDQALFGASGQSRIVSGPRLSDLRVSASTEGAPIPRLYGRARLGGQIIWATDFEEEIVRSGESSGSGKGTAGSTAATTTTIEYRYYANIAVALAEGEIAGIGRVWADGLEIDLAEHTWRLHAGSETQLPDGLILAREGEGNAPAYRGVAYIVFERLALAPYGNRIPQLSFEVHRSVDPVNGLIRGVVLIPGSGEFVYAVDSVTRVAGGGASAAENTSTRQGGTNWTVALDQLEATLPNAEAASLVVSWFGNDLRAGHCQLRPAVEIASKSTSPREWSVAGLTRGTAPVMSLTDGRPSYGGTPDDHSVVGAIRDLAARGISVTLNPFILLDIPADNTLPDPYTGAAAQPAHPWRGRITCDPAPGRPGTVDKSSAVLSQIASFIGTASPADFALSGDTVVYSGPAEWSLRRMILHYAWLAKAAGGVDAFLIGSELRGLTTLRSATSTYPVVAALVTLANDVKSVLGPAVKVSYAADWSEYFGHQPADGSGDVHFHLDPLWSSPSVDAVGIDLYWPLADWRDGSGHLDAAAGTRSIHELAYLKSNIRGGEGFDWYYASDSDRADQVRTPITDGAGKPWVFRYKDLRSWWLSQHFDRPGGTEAPTPTAWVPQSKPVWLMEVGCPAVDKGPNQPNVFVDPKSTESSLPHFSLGTRDDLAQRRYIQALIEGFDPTHPGYLAGANPTSTVYGAPMIELGRIHVYAWDARPYPVFPADSDTWGDAGNWQLGHWLNGRMASASLDSVLARIASDFDTPEIDASRLHGMVPGYVIDRIMSARDAIQPLELAFFFDTLETGGAIACRHRGAEPPVAVVTEDDLVEERSGSDLATLTRAQETELPAAAKITFSAVEADYRQGVVEARRLVGASGRVATAELPFVLESGHAAAIADSWLFESWAARERASLTLPPSRLALEPADALLVQLGGRTHTLRITALSEHGSRAIEALSLDPDVYGASVTPRRDARVVPPPLAGQPLAYFLDLPLLRDGDPPSAGYIAATQSPWPGSVAIYRSPDSSGYVLASRALAPAVTGVTLDALPAGPEGRLDRASSVRVRLDRGALASVTETAMLSGANAAAVETSPGRWEVLQFTSAELAAPLTYRLSLLLRAQAGSDDAMSASVAAGARFVLLDASLARIDLSGADLGLPLSWRYGPAGQAIGSAGFVTRTHAFQGRGLVPLSPCHVRGHRSGGDLTISWVRRTRLSGDSWDQVEVPLGEDSESYAVDILDGATVKRTLISSTPSALYSAAAQTADFGAPPATVDVRVHHLSATRGRGTPRPATI